MQLKSDKILAILDKRNETQSDIGARLGVSRQLVGAWIHGDRNPKYCSVQRIAEALGCSVFDIAEFENSAEEEAVKLGTQETDFIFARIQEIYSGLDRARRAELLAAAERLAAVNVRREDIDLRPLRREGTTPKMTPELRDHIIKEAEYPTTNVPRAKLDGLPLIHNEHVCPRCGRPFYLPRFKKPGKIACPTCGLHIVPIPDAKK